MTVWKSLPSGCCLPCCLRLLIALISTFHAVRVRVRAAGRGKGRAGARVRVRVRARIRVRVTVRVRVSHGVSATLAPAAAAGGELGRRAVAALPPLLA